MENKRKIKNNFFNINKFTILVFCIFSFIYYLDTNKINFAKNKIFSRKLGEKDPRSSKPNENCMEIDDYTLFDLFPLEDVKVDLGDNIIFRFCHNTKEMKNSSCIYKKEDSKIIRLSGDIDGEKDNKNKVEVKNPEEESDRSVTLYLAAGDKYINDQNKRYKIEILLLCNQSVDFNILDNTKFNPETSNELFFKAQSKYACGDDDAYIHLSKGSRVVVGIILVVAGLLVGILGYKIRKVGIIIICCALSLVVSLLIISLCDITKTAINIVLIVIFLIGGIALSILFNKKDEYLKYYMVIIGGVCGYPLGEIIYNLCFAVIDTSKQELIRIIIIVSLIVIGVVLGFIWPKYTCIFGTSIVGGYCMMRGIAFFLYGKVEFIEEQKLYDLAQSGNYEKIADMIWGEYLMYPGLLIAFTIIFIIAQIKITPDWLEAGYKGLDKFTGDLPELKADFKLNEFSETKEDDEENKE